MTSSAFLLTILVGPAVPVPLPRAALDALQEVEVTQATEAESGFSLKFSIDTKSTLQNLLLVGAQTTPALRVVIVVTIGGQAQVLMDGVVDRTEMSGGSGGEVTLTVLGKDLSSAMNRIDKTGLPYPAMPVAVRVLACLAPYAAFGVVPVVIPPILTVVKSPTSEIPKHKGTDLDYIREMARETGYVFYVDPGPAPGTSTAYFGPEIRIGIPQPALTVNSDGFSNVSSVELSISGTERKIPVLMIQEPKSKIPLPIPLPSISLANPPFGIVPPRLAGFEKLEDIGAKSPIEVALKGLATAAKAADAVSASGTVDPLRYGRLLRARGVVGLRGAGLAFDGLYFVKSVTTTVKTGSISQKFQLVRNGLVSTVARVAA